MLRFESKWAEQQTSIAIPRAIPAAWLKYINIKYVSGDLSQVFLASVYTELCCSNAQLTCLHCISAELYNHQHCLHAQHSNHQYFFILSFP